MNMIVDFKESNSAFDVDFKADSKLDVEFKGAVYVGSSEGGSYSEGYDAGFEIGKNEGLEEGYQTGYNKGNADGQTAGYNTGLAEGQEIGYNTGYSEGQTAGYNSGYSEGQSKGYADGEQAGHQAGYTEGYTEGNEQGYNTGYSEGQTAGAEIAKAKPYIDTSKITDFRYFNQEGKRTAILSKLDTSNGTNFYYFCYLATDVVTVDLDFSKATQCVNAFSGCTALETVVYLDFSSMAWGSGNLSGMFTGCTALKNVTLKPNCLQANISFSACSLLTDESVQSIIGGLGWNDKGRKLTLHSDVKAKLTDAQKEQILLKGWATA